MQTCEDAKFVSNLAISALLCKVAALRSFSQDKLQYWRESASGISSLAHFVSKDTVDMFNILIKPVVYLSMFYFFSNPRSSFGFNYVVLLCLVYCVTGIAYALAIFLEPGPSQLVTGPFLTSLYYSCVSLDYDRDPMLSLPAVLGSTPRRADPHFNSSECKQLSKRYSELLLSKVGSRSIRYCKC